MSINASQDAGQARSEQGLPLACRFFGHDHTFGHDGSTMVWECRRGCGVGGSKTYSSAAEATRYAAVFGRRDSEDLGRRAPLIGLLPLRLWRWWRRRNNHEGAPR